MLSYAMTINKSQGQSLRFVGLYCRYWYLVTVSYTLQSLEFKVNMG